MINLESIRKVEPDEQKRNTVNSTHMKECNTDSKEKFLVIYLKMNRISK